MRDAGLVVITIRGLQIPLETNLNSAEAASAVNG